MAYGLISHLPESADAERILKYNRKHWGVESHHYILDWNWNEDRCSISKKHGPEKHHMPKKICHRITQAMGKDSIASVIRKLARNVRMLFDYLRMTDNTKKHLIQPLKSAF